LSFGTALSEATEANGYGSDHHQGERRRLWDGGGVNRCIAPVYEYSGNGSDFSSHSAKASAFTRRHSLHRRHGHVRGLDGEDVNARDWREVINRLQRKDGYSRREDSLARLLLVLRFRVCLE
jgi:hypothetical protein